MPSVIRRIPLPTGADRHRFYITDASGKNLAQSVGAYNDPKKAAAILKEMERVVACDFDGSTSVLTLEQLAKMSGCTVAELEAYLTDEDKQGMTERFAGNVDGLASTHKQLLANAEELAQLKKGNATLTEQRDNRAADLRHMTDMRDEARKVLGVMRAERNAAREALQNAEAQRDNAQAEVRTLTDDLAEKAETGKVMQAMIDAQAVHIRFLQLPWPRSLWAWVFKVPRP